MPVDITATTEREYIDPTTQDRITLKLRQPRGKVYVKWRDRFMLALVQPGASQETTDMARAILPLLPEFAVDLIADASGAVVKIADREIAVCAAMTPDEVSLLAAADEAQLSGFGATFGHFFPDVALQAAKDEWARFGLVSLAPLAMGPAAPSSETPGSTGTRTPAA